MSSMHVALFTFSLAVDSQICISRRSHSPEIHSALPYSLHLDSPQAPQTPHG